jgi:hypothetical protein
VSFSKRTRIGQSYRYFQFFFSFSTPLVSALSPFLFELQRLILISYVSASMNFRKLVQILVFHTYLSVLPGQLSGVPEMAGVANLLTTLSTEGI